MHIRYLSPLLIFLLPAANAQQLTPMQQMGKQNFIQSNNPLNYLLNNPMNNSSAVNPYATYQNNPYATSPYAFLSHSTISQGTIINGTLEETISSKSSKAGDVFSILLTDGYTANNTLLIPKNSKIIGSVISVNPAKKTRHGNPGTLQVSLQTLVTPDNITIPINASIDYNPNQPKSVDPQKGRGVPLAEYGKSLEYSVYGAASSLGNMLGVPFLYRNQNGKGADFTINKGELVPVKLNQLLDVTSLKASKDNASISSPEPNQTLPNDQPASINQRITPSQPAPQVPPIISQPANQYGSAPGLSPLFQENTENMLPGSVLPAGPEPF